MPPKKQVKREKSKFRRRVRSTETRKGKRKTSQKQIVNVSVTSSGSGGSGMGVPSLPTFLPSYYQQPLFTPPIDHIRNTLTEVLTKVPADIDSIKKPPTEAMKTPDDESWKYEKGTIASDNVRKQLRFSSPRTYSSPSGSTFTPDSDYQSANESISRRKLPAPRDEPPALTPEGKPFWAGVGRKSNAYKVWEANQKK